MNLYYEGHRLSGTPAEIAEFIKLITPVSITATMSDKELEQYFPHVDNIETITVPNNNNYTLYFRGKSIYDMDAGELREAMAYEHLDKLCDIETMTREEMIKFLDSYYQTRR